MIAFSYSFVTDADIGPNRSLTFPTAQCNEDKSNHLCTCILSQRTNNRQVLTGPDTNHILKAVKLKWVIIKLLLYCACADWKITNKIRQRRVKTKKVLMIQPYLNDAFMAQFDIRQTFRYTHIENTIFRFVLF